MSSPASGSSPGDGQTSAAFGLLHERVRRWVWEQGWSALRDTQEEAIPVILAGTADVIIAAATAGGKTEAAFLPICSRLAGEPGGGVRVLYVSPLKALINDQFDRLERLCERLEIAVHRWHGDVSGAARQRLLRDPSGLLLITPESLEALFVLRGEAVRSLFSDLHYVVVDELHSFIGTERGRQLQSLLHRVEAVLGRRAPRIALSATLGDMSLAAGFLRPGAAEGVRVLVSREGGQELRLQLRGYRTAVPRLNSRSDTALEGGTTGGDGEDEIDEGEGGDVLAISEHLFTTLRGSHSLIFANRRADVEAYADRLRRRSERDRLPNEFWPHHGSLSREIRTDVEAMLKDPARPVTVVCTTTLEMGIDIGDLSSIAQIGPPPSVAAMRQRLGRSGRRGGPAVMRMYIQEPDITASTSTQDTLRAGLVQTIAMVNLLVAGWYEPPSRAALHLSTLVQQTLSLVAQHGGVRPLHAWRLLCGSGPFAGVDQSRFAALLRSLGRHDLLVQTSDGTLLPGEVGERIINHYSFYAAFTTPEEFRIVHETKTLGTLPISYPLAEDTLLIFAGRRWRIVKIDGRGHTIVVIPAFGGRPPRFAGGGALVHDTVRREMQAVYLSTDIPTFLDAQARDLLAEAREHFRRYRLEERALLSSGQDVLVFCWMDDRVMNTLLLHLRARGLEVSHAGLALEIAEAGVEGVLAHLEAIAEAGPVAGSDLAATVVNKATEKYDWFLSEELLAADFASRNLDPDGAWRTACSLIEQEHAAT